MTEKQFETQVKNFLESKNIVQPSCPHVELLIRNNSLNGWYVKIWGGGFQRAGIPDILACINGYFVAVELKGPTGKHTKLQEHNIRLINESRGIGLILYPHQFHEFKTLVDKLLRR